MKKPALKPIKDATVAIRMTAHLKGQIERAAISDRRSVSQWIEGLILDALAKSPAPRARRKKSDGE